MIPFLLLFLGLILILLEFYLPGGIIGILGGISIISGILLFASETSSIWALLLFIAGTSVAVGLLIRFALWRIVHTKPEYSIYSNDDQEGYFASSYDKSAIGKTGIVVSDLKPGGYIIVEGQQHPAISLSGYIARGAQVAIVGGQEQSLMVTQKDQHDDAIIANDNS
jgi:membrane-bound ClpP family serine protease